MATLDHGFLSEAWSQLRGDSRLTAIQSRVSYEGALSGRDITAVNRTTDGLLKLSILYYSDAKEALLKALLD